MKQIRTSGPSATGHRRWGGRGKLSICALAGIALLAGCRQDMQDQPKIIPQRSSDFFADGRSARPQVEHTVARTQLREDQYFYTGLVNGKEQDALPFPATLAVLERGQERYNVYCTPCHSRVGNGQGMIVERGYKPAGNYHDAKRLAQPLSHFFYVMTNGYGAMPDYSAQLTPADRWAVAAYIRALQLSQNAKESDVPQGAQVHNLSDIAEQQGLPASFAGPWPVAESTNVMAKPANAATPANAPAQNPNPPASKNHAPVNPSTTNSSTTN
jgi:mono/diheme cytochrome c family protein